LSSILADVSNPTASEVNGEPIRFEGNIEDRQYVRSVSDRIMQRIACLSRESAQRIGAPQASRSNGWLSTRLARVH
jgi:hypothetical protein